MVPKNTSLRVYVGQLLFHLTIFAFAGCSSAEESADSDAETTPAQIDAHPSKISGSGAMGGNDGGAAATNSGVPPNTGGSAGGVPPNTGGSAGGLDDRPATAHVVGCDPASAGDLDPFVGLYEIIESVRSDSTCRLQDAQPSPLSKPLLRLKKFTSILGDIGINPYFCDTASSCESNPALGNLAFFQHTSPLGLKSQSSIAQGPWNGQCRWGFWMQFHLTKTVEGINIHSFRMAGQNHSITTEAGCDLAKKPQCNAQAVVTGCDRVSRIVARRIGS
jgi:hypothetical protein